MPSTLSFIALLSLILTTALLIVSFVTSHWLRIGRINRSGLCACTRCDCGIWYFCADATMNIKELRRDGGYCSGFLSGDGQLETTLPDWFKAVQCLMTKATVSEVTSLLLSLVALCLPCSLDRIITIAVTLTALLLTISVSVFGAKVSHLSDITQVIEGYEELPQMSWSYWAAVVTTIASWATAICFVFVCRLKRSSLYSV